LQRIVLGISLGPKVRNKEFSTEEEEEEPAKRRREEEPAK